ncbi:hypothetical protein I3842_12G079400 [Carya illinoinensis]|uniref:beta-ketoacyl-[acyl-carrier-protein] synthase I n=1 Tax=Carya illinoinensis TaxID=32201 RepID=A0A922DI58_CARIL|nr:hypothetical protein I3842_12G079400 [Carya illinoinensis]
MAAIAGNVPSGALFRARLSGDNGIPLVQFNGLRPGDNMQTASRRPRSSWLISTKAPKCRAIKAIASASSATKREKDPKKRVVITGLGLVSIFGSEIDTFCNKLLEGECGIHLIDRFDASKYSIRFAGRIRDFSSEGYVDRKNDHGLDDSWRYFLQKMDRTKIGVLIGTGLGGMKSFSNGVEALIHKGYNKIPPFFKREVDIMVAGGTEAAVCPVGIGGFIACQALSQCNDEPQKASRPRDKDPDGFVMGERSGLLYLGGATCDAYHITDPRSDGLAVSYCITKSLEDAGISPEETLPWGCRWTGSREAIATIKAITTGWLHPTINQDNLEPDVTIDTFPNVKKSTKLMLLSLSNSFGFGGQNSLVVFAPFTP